MASYIILTPASGPGIDHEATRFVRDGFSLVAFLVPGIWLLSHRLWLLAIGAFLIEGIGFALVNSAGYWPAGYAILIALRILTAVEGGMLYSRALVANGWSAVGLLSARNVDEAEEVYFSSLPTEEKQEVPKANWDISGKTSSPAGRTTLGLIGYDGGRA